MFQQLYINKYHPHAAKDAPVTGAVGKTLRPEAGQKPKRDARGRPIAAEPKSGAQPSPVQLSKTSKAADDETQAAEAPVRSTTPRPGQRPNRPSGGGKRPPGKKKRR
jgi:hypothetical protein